MTKELQYVYRILRKEEESKIMKFMSDAIMSPNNVSASRAHGKQPRKVQTKETRRITNA